MCFRFERHQRGYGVIKRSRPLFSALSNCNHWDGIFFSQATQSRLPRWSQRRSAPQLEELAVCLLDASPEAQAERLNSRGDDPAVLHHHHAFADWMRKTATNPLHMPEVITMNGWDQMQWERVERMAGDWHVSILDTSTKDRTEAGAEVLAWCRLSLSGQTETMRLREILR